MFTSHSLALAAAVAGQDPTPNSYNLQVSQRYGFKYHQITKCGCSFVKVLINQLDGRASSAEPIKADWSSGGPPAFVIVRNPIDRFISLYFDKIFRGPSHIGRKFLVRGLIDRDAASVAQHQLNCAQALGWINSTIKGCSPEKPNYHWRPQIRRLHKISKLNVHMLTLDGLSWQLPYILRDTCPDIETVMQRVGVRNQSPKPCSPAQIASQKLRRQISRIYAADERVYAEVNRHWAKIGAGLGHHGQDIKQTARGWLVTDRQARRDHIQRGCEQG
jgi:hypothetical protein